MRQKNESGAWGEERAAAFLKKRGYTLIERNFQVRGGEIDIIAENKNYLVFAEVKTRKDESYGEAKEFVTPAKQGKIRLAASLWLANHETGKQPRFDVIEVYAPRGIYTIRPLINHIENAFE